MKVCYITLFVVFLLKFNDVSSANCIRLDNKDFPGNDVGGVYSSSADDCCNKCYNKWNCIAWTRATSGTCWMKSKISSIGSFNGVVSGVMANRNIVPWGFSDSSATKERYANKDSAGNDLHSSIISLKQESDCCQLCSLWKDSCKGYVWNHASNTCWLKKAIGTLKSLSIANVGVLEGSESVTPSPTICTPKERKANTDSAGNDLHSVTISLNSESECCQKCKGRSDCVAYVWNHAANQCWLKSALGTLKSLSIAHLGIVRGSGPSSCGLTPIEPVGDIAGIIGGTTAKPFSWPWQILLKTVTSSGTFQCGGSLIDQNWVLTASHCLNTNPEANGVTVYAGLFKQIESMSGQAQTLKVEKYYRNPKYVGGAGPQAVDGEDVALIKLKTPAAFNNKVQKVCLPKDDSEMVVKGARMTVTGWGLTSLYGFGSDPLKQLTVENILTAGGYCDTKDEICAPGRESGGSFYSGDSGGPLVRKKVGKWFQYGVVSGWKNWNDGRGNIVQDITVYAHLSIHCKWIREVTGMEICQ